MLSEHISKIIPAPVKAKMCEWANHWFDESRSWIERKNKSGFSANSALRKAEILYQLVGKDICLEQPVTEDLRWYIEWQLKSEKENIAKAYAIDTMSYLYENSLWR